ncbi:MAG: glutamine--tRNA ligase/YqeY domain fusion protein [Clostridiales bacterium]|jgi:glutaminyl-tRNA synthetase|nr:glutamine--tRNA ligase/YqeY domain fusion protein [Clostridiales bacterium]
MANNFIETASFIHEYIKKDLKKTSELVTRFPPEPNGYLHIGHAKSICLNFGLAKIYDGKCNLRLDDTNPAKENREYIDSIINDIKWLGFDYGERLFFASDYFEKFYEYAIYLIKKSKAYVCDLTPEEIKKFRGNLNESGRESPYRNRIIKENLVLFEKMRNGEFEDSSRTLRAKIDMDSPNINMRDPVIYRIARICHHNSKNKWCIYPMYDFAHPLEDAIEKVTHSICTMEFEDHKPLYNWVIENCDFKKKPRQIEFAKLSLTQTIMGKRYLKELVDNKEVDGWDDPRLPTISGIRRRGYTPDSIKKFCESIGISKADNNVDISFLEHCIRDDLKLKSKIYMAILNPLKIIIENYREDNFEYLDIENHSATENMGKRKVLFSKEIYIERSDFLEDAPKKFYRLTKNQEVRLKGAYFIKFLEAIKDENGNILELVCEYDPKTKSGSNFSNKKAKGTIQWVSCKEFIKAEIREYDYLLLKNGKKNPETLKIKKNCVLEFSTKNILIDERVQFMRHGFFIKDCKYCNDDNIVFNKIVGLKSSYK